MRYLPAVFVFFMLFGSYQAHAKCESSIYYVNSCFGGEPVSVILTTSDKGPMPSLQLACPPCETQNYMHCPLTWPDYSACDAGSYSAWQTRMKTDCEEDGGTDCSKEAYCAAHCTGGGAQCDTVDGQSPPADKDAYCGGEANSYCSSSSGSPGESSEGSGSTPPPTQPPYPSGLPPEPPMGAPDGDKDGIPDELESQTGSDPNDRDSDDDGVDDGLDSDLDSDGDGIKNGSDAFPIDGDANNNGVADGEDDDDSDGVKNEDETNPGPSTAPPPSDDEETPPPLPDECDQTGAFGCDMIVRCCMDFDEDGHGSAQGYMLGDACMQILVCGESTSCESLSSSPYPDGSSISYLPNCGDCDDSDALIHPGTPDAKDGLDNDCDGVVDEDIPPPAYAIYYRDADGDGFGNPNDQLASESPKSGYVIDANDCNDSDPSTHPGAVDTCDGKDNNCDGTADGYYEVPGGMHWYCQARPSPEDSDADGYSIYMTDDVSTCIASLASSGYGLEYCDCAYVCSEQQPAGTYSMMATGDEDCNDKNANMYPGNPEKCDGIDNDCDQTVDDGCK